MSDYKDLAVELLADSEAALQERVANLEQDIAVYRELVQQALTVVHDVTIERDRLREQHHRLLDEYRHLRIQTMRQAAA
jgi:hypothetical protein